MLCLVMVLATVPARAFERACAMDMESAGGCCCCGGEREAPEGDRGCAMPASASLACCEQSATIPSQSSLPASGAACQELQVAIASVVPLDRPVVTRSRRIEAQPDVIAAERQRTYLHVSSFLI